MEWTERKKVWKKWQKKYLGQPYHCRCYTLRWPGTHTAQCKHNLAKGHKNWNKLMKLSKKYMSKYCRPTFSWKWPFWSMPDTHILLLLFYNSAACILYLQYYTWLVFFLYVLKFLRRHNPFSNWECSRYIIITMFAFGQYTIRVRRCTHHRRVWSSQFVNLPPTVSLREL